MWELWVHLRAGTVVRWRTGTLDECLRAEAEGVLRFGYVDWRLKVA